MFDDEICFAAPLGSPYAERATIDLRDLREEKFVTLGEDFATHRDFMHAFELAGFQPHIAMRVGDIFSLTNLVSGGVGYALLPHRVAEFSPQVQFIALDARYATSRGILFAVYVHPLSTMDRATLVSAIHQVASLATTFGTAYTAGATAF